MIHGVRSFSDTGPNDTCFTARLIFKTIQYQILKLLRFSITIRINTGNSVATVIICWASFFCNMPFVQHSKCSSIVSPNTTDSNLVQNLHCAFPFNTPFNASPDFGGHHSDMSTLAICGHPENMLIKQWHCLCTATRGHPAKNSFELEEQLLLV